MLNKLADVQFQFMGKLSSPRLEDYNICIDLISMVQRENRQMICLTKYISEFLMITV